MSTGILFQDLGFEDFIPVFPDVNDERIQSLISSKKEFDEVRGQIKEAIRKPGQFYRHQKAFLRYMIMADRMLNIHETGTGKSCAFVALAEYYKKNSDQIKHVYVLEKGPSTVNEFKYQIAHKCNDPEEYLTEQVRNSQTVRAKKGALSRQINKWYTVETYRKFASEAENLSNEEIEERYSECIFLVDEVHNLRNENETDVIEKEWVAGVYNVLWRVFHIIKRSKVILASATPMINKVGEIARIMNLILPEEHQMPLLRTPRDMWNYNWVTLKQIEPFFRGRISYVRNLDTGARPIFQGDPVELSYEMTLPAPGWEPTNKQIQEAYGPHPPNAIIPQPIPQLVEKEVKSKLRLYTTKMSPYQNSVYNLSKMETDRTFFTAPRQASSFAFPPSKKAPNGSWGSEQGGFDQFVTSPRPGEYQATPELLAYIRNVAKKPGKEKDDLNLYTLSCKFNAILNIELDTDPQRPGNSFIYTEFVRGSGAIVLGLCFQANGFELFNEVDSVFISSGGKKIGIKPSFKPKRRYALMNGETNPNTIDAIKELFNSPENTHGEYLQVIIGSEIVRDGINLFNVIRAHLESPDWHNSGITQALSRFLRADSYDRLIAEKRVDLERRGLDPNDATVEVKIYKHNAEDSAGDSIDFQMYKLAEEKDLEIRRMMRFMKQCAIDCIIHYDRNVREGDVDFSPECDYQECNYLCYTDDPNLPNRGRPQPEELDFSTYDILYSNEVVEECARDISKLMTQKGLVTFDDLYAIWSPEPYRPKFIVMAVDKLITERRELRDRFGYPSYLNSDGFHIYTQRDFPLTDQSSQEDLSLYGQQITGIFTTPFQRIVDQSQELKQADIIEELYQILPLEVDKEKEKKLSVDEKEAYQNRIKENRKRVSDLIDELNLDSKAQIVEDSLQLLANGKDTQTASFIRKKFKDYIYTFREPWEDIYLTAYELANRFGERGRKPLAPTTGKSIKLKKSEKGKLKGVPKEGATYGEFTTEETKIRHPDFGKPVEDVYLHTLYTLGTGTTSYETTSRFYKALGRVRIYKKSENLGWRDVNPYEFGNYNRLIQENKQETVVERYAKNKIYGTILADGKFRIVDLTKEVGDTEDTRKAKKGSVCDNMKKPELISIIVKSFLIDEDVYNFPLDPSITREDMIEYLLTKKFSKERDSLEALSQEILSYIFKWYYSDKTIGYICEFLRKSLPIRKV